MKPLIIVDIHEKRSKVFKYLENSFDVDYQIKPLFIGDYITGGVVIERKTVSDFLTGLSTGRLNDQIRKMQETEKRLLIIEGLLNQFDGIEKRRLYGSFISLLLYKNMKILFTENAWETYHVLTILSKQKIYSNEKALAFALKKTRTSNEILRIKVVSNIYGIGPITANKLITRFGSIQNMVNAEDSDLQEIIGERTKQFLEIVRG